MSAQSPDSFNARRTLTVGDKSYTYYDLKEAEKNGLSGISSLPFSLKVLLENLLRNEDGRSVTRADIEAMAGWLVSQDESPESELDPSVGVASFEIGRAHV